MTEKAPSLRPTNFPPSSAYGTESYVLSLLNKAVGAKASDVHFKVGQPPSARINGALVHFQTDKLTGEDTARVASHVLGRVHQDVSLDTLRELDASYEAPGVGRFRVNVYRQRGSIALVLRHIPSVVPDFDTLGLPSAPRELAEKERGLVLVVGAAGQGKSTTLASMLAHINRTKPVHIVTIEDPIEFIHADDRASISQREVGIDTGTFAEALRAALRQDPDVILVGEIRDEETMDTALMAAETGHLVLSTVHTPGVERTFGRLLSLASRQGSHAEHELRDRLASAIQGVVAQRLVRRRDAGQVLLTEVLVASGTVRESIRRPEHNPSLRELMEKGAHPYGMHTFEMRASELVQEGVIDAAAFTSASGF